MKKIIFTVIVASILFISCGKNNFKKSDANKMPITGTWQLITGITIAGNDTVITDYTKKLSFIKIINDSHFAFLKHELKNGADTTRIFEAGGGRYDLTDSTYTEHLEYCSEKVWEGNDFKFTISIKKDTLIQTGIEKVQNAGVNRLNIEKYVQLKNNR